MTEIPGRADPTYDVLGDASGSPRDPTYDVGGGDATHGDDATYGDGATYDAGRDVKREGGDPAAIPDPAVDRDRRWRLALGADPDGERTDLTSDERAMDLALAALYDRGPRDPATDRPDSPDAPADRAPGLGASAPRVARWLGDIRTYFPSRVVQVMQSDAIERLGLRRLLLEPEMLASVEPDVHLVATLAALRGVIPEASKATAREVVRRVVDDVEARLADKLRQAVRGALHRAARTRRPRHADIDWARTVRANLQHYQPDYRTVVPERLVGYARRQSGFQRHVVLCVDQSGSMASSVVYASILACVLASIRAVRTSLVVYGTAVVDLTDQLADPVDVIFGTQLGGGTDTAPALAYCAGLITDPRASVLVLISDLFDSNPETMLARLVDLRASGVCVVVLLALTDAGTPGYSTEVAQRLADQGLPAFGCTPDAFPELIALALNHGDVAAWAQREQEAAAHGG
jgi:Mg-chelatase subunit ChlD